MTDLQRAKDSIPVRFLGAKNKREKIREELLKNANDVMKSANPWSVKRFLEEVTDPSWNSTFYIIEQGKTGETCFDMNTVFESKKFHVICIFFN